MKGFEVFKERAKVGARGEAEGAEGCAQRETSSVAQKARVTECGCREKWKLFDPREDRESFSLAASPNKAPPLCSPRRDHHGENRSIHMSCKVSTRAPHLRNEQKSAACFELSEAGRGAEGKCERRELTSATPMSRRTRRNK